MIIKNHENLRRVTHEKLNKKPCYLKRQSKHDLETMQETDYVHNLQFDITGSMRLYFSMFKMFNLIQRLF